MGNPIATAREERMPNGTPAESSTSSEVTPQNMLAEQSHPLPRFITVPPTPPSYTPIEYILYGPPVDPVDRIRRYSEEDFEDFIREWAFLFKQCKQKAYCQVGRFGGAGDMGRDVVGYIDPPNSGKRLDIYQCKHYGHGLQPNEVWAELGKLCYYTFRKAFAVPEQYYFVCPEDAGPELGRLLENPESLRTRLISEWEKHVESEIVKKQRIKLEGDFLDYVNAFDLNRIHCKPIEEIVKEFRETTRFSPRFGGGLVIPRSPNKAPPENIEEHEQRYIAQLIQAYQDHKNKTVCMETLSDHPQFNKHFSTSRVRYFCAETLRQDVRDNLPQGVTFEQLQDQVQDYVVDICDNEQHSSGYIRVNAVTDHAGNYVPQDHPLKGYLNSPILKGICHQLANEDKLKWVQK